MTLEKFFLTKDAAEKGIGSIGNEASTYYMYDGRNLEFYFHGNTSFVTVASIGDAFAVRISPSGLSVVPIVLPRKPGDLAMWICGYPKALRTHNFEDFEDIIVEQRLQNTWVYYKETVYYGHGCGFGYCNREDHGGIKMLGAYCEDDPRSVEELVNQWVIDRGLRYPAYYVKKALAAVGAECFTVDELFEKEQA